MPADRVAVRPMSVADLPAVAAWLAEPAIARWWDLTPSVDAVADRYMPRILGEEPTTMLIVEVDGRPLGWGQHYEWADYYAAGVAPPGAGIDYALSAPARGRGLGALVVDAVAISVQHERNSVSVIGASPSVANVASCRALVLAGFDPGPIVDLDGTGPQRLHTRPAGRPGLLASLTATEAWFERNSGWAPPPPETLADWAADGGCRCPDECWVPPHHPCEHGLATWATILRHR